MAMFSYGSNWQYYLKDVASSNKVVKQDFYTKTHFNTLEFKAKHLIQQNSQYSITLQSKGKILFEKAIDPSVLQKEVLAFPITVQKPKGLQKYTIIIKPLSDKDSLDFAIDKYAALPKYNGNLLINNKKQYGNLLLKVYYKHNSPMLSPYIYWCIVGFVVVIQLLSVLLIIRKE